MTDITVEKKLELMRQIRSRYQRDRYDLFHREQVLYGRAKPIPGEESMRKAFFVDSMDEMENYDEDDAESFQTFPLRMLLAVGLFLLIIVCDMSDKSFLGLEASQCFSAISADYESSISAWVDAASAQTVSNTGSSGQDKVEENPPAGSRP